jgi:hypothetical protein
MWFAQSGNPGLEFNIRGKFFNGFLRLLEKLPLGHKIGAGATIV